MEADLHIVGAFDTLAQEAVSEAAFDAELQRRGLNPADAALLRERGLLLGLLVRAPDGSLRRGPETLRHERLAGEPPATQ